MPTVKGRGRDSHFVSEKKEIDRSKSHKASLHTSLILTSVEYLDIYVDFLIFCIVLTINDVNYLMFD